MTTERFQQLLQIFVDEVENFDDLLHFSKTYSKELDNDFFNGALTVLQGLKEREIDYRVQELQQLLEGIIIAEDVLIRDMLREKHVCEAYPYAVGNLGRAQSLDSPEIIMKCAFTLARTAENYQPYPKYDEAITLYQLASEKALHIQQRQTYADAQNNLGVVYWKIPTGDRELNLHEAMACYQRALEVYTPETDPEDYAMVQSNLGNVYGDLTTGTRETNLNRAITCYQQALKIYTLQKFPYEYARTQHNLGAAYKDLAVIASAQNYSKALTCFEKALQVYTKHDFPYEHAKTLNNLGVIYREMPTGDVAENLHNAICCYQEMLTICLEQQFPSEYALAQNNLGSVYAILPTGNQRENITRAIECYHQALRIRTAQRFPLDYAHTHKNLGAAYRKLPGENRSQNLCQAIHHYEEALRIYTREKFPHEYAEIQCHLGDIHVSFPAGNRNRYLKKAITCYCNALQIVTREQFPEQYARIQSLVGNVYAEISDTQQQRNFLKAIEAYQCALDVYTEEHFPQEYAAIQNNLGRVYWKFPIGDRGQYLSMAITAFEKALRIYTFDSFPEDYAMVQNNLGLVYRELFVRELTSSAVRGYDLRRAIDAYTNALDVYTKEDFPKRYASTQNNLGIAYAELPDGDETENLQQAVIAYHEALQIYTRTDFPGEYALTQNNLGTAYWKLSEFQDKEENLQQAITAYQNALQIRTEKDFPQDFAATQNNLGVAYAAFHTGEQKETILWAIEAYQQALRVRIREVFPEDRVKTLYNLALAYSMPPLNNYQEAYHVCKEAIEILEDVRTTSSMATRRALAMYYGESVYDEIVSLCIRLGHTGEAWQYAERGKSRTLVEMLHVQHQKSTIGMKELVELLPPKTLVIEFFTGGKGTYVWGIEGQSSNTGFVLTLNNAHGLYIEKLVRDHWYFPYYSKQNLENMIQLVETYMTFAPNEEGQLDEPRSQILTAVDAIEEWCKEIGIELLSEIYRLKEALRSDRFHEINEILAHLKTHPVYLSATQNFQHRNAIHNILQTLAEELWYATDSTGQSLALFVDQIAPERIIFVPHSGLHLFPLHVLPLLDAEGSDSGDLPGTEGQKTLLDNYEIAYVSSSSLLQATLQREKNSSNRLCAVANPDRSLKFADYEVQEIASWFQDDNTILWYEQATKEAVSKEIQTARIIHFACHGQFHVDKPITSCLLLAGESQESQALTLDEIFKNLQLPEADLVVLSACETGMVQVERGDEYIGLPGGFLYAGSSTVISSLWTVDEFSTTLMMNCLYENMISKKMSKAAALREAQLWVRDLTYKELVEYLEDASLGQHLAYTILRGLQRSAKRNPDKKPFEHPYYWGAFTCNGSWE